MGGSQSMIKDGKIVSIPEVNDDKVQLFIDGEFAGNVTTEQFNKLRNEMVKYAYYSKDKSIFDRVYIVGHEDSNKEMGEEIKITFTGVKGNMTDIPWEFAHWRRANLRLFQFQIENNKRKETNR